MFSNTIKYCATAMKGSTLLPDTQHTSTGALLAGMLLCLWDLPVSMVGFIFECLTYPDIMRLQLALTRPNRIQENVWMAPHLSRPRMATQVF